MSEMRHERPGVYSVYDASSVTSAGRAAKRIGVAALAVKGTANTAVTLTGYGAGVEVFGEDGADTPGMSTLLKLLFANGASTVYAVRVDAGGGLEAYQAAFAALANCDVQVVVCDSSELTIQKALKTAVETASAARGERIGVIGGSGDTAAQLVTRAEAINSERMVLVGPDMKDESGKALSGVFAAAAVAGAIACGADPAVPLNGAELYGISPQSLCMIRRTIFRRRLWRGSRAGLFRLRNTLLCPRPHCSRCCLAAECRLWQIGTALRRAQAQGFEASFSYCLSEFQIDSGFHHAPHSGVVCPAPPA